MEPIKKKTLLTVAILIIGSILAVSFNNAPVSAYQSTGIAIDFGERNVTWTDMDLNEYGDPYDALEEACNQNGYTLTKDDGTVTEINGIANVGDYSWGLWVVESSSVEWKKLSIPYGDISGYSVTSWAYCYDDGDIAETPTVGVDQYGRCIYGYSQANRVVTLSPSLTEIIGSLNAVNTLVGTDGGYKGSSNYPDSVIVAKNNGDILTVGDYTTPSFEYILKTDPDIVFCDGSQYSHFEMAEKLRKASIPAIVLYAGESTDTIKDNIYIMGMAMRYELRALEVISMLDDAEADIVKMIGSGSTVSKDLMVALSPDKSPWVSGYDTYVDDIINTVMGENAFASEYGWVQVNSEMIPNNNPSLIIVIAEAYGATQSEYDALLDSLSKEWKETDAFRDGNIYVFCDDLAEMSMRPGPRYAQLMELVTLILHFPSEVPKYIGDEYEGYLTITKHLGFNSQR